MWALGIILYELATRQHPISKETDITDGNPIKIPSTVPPLIRALIAKLLEKNPAKRPSAAEVLK
jgi:serine/threonine protein kinase